MGTAVRSGNWDRSFVDFLKLLNRRQTFNCIITHKGEMKYVFGWVAGNINFYEEVTDSTSFPKRLWCSVVSRLWDLE